MPRCAVKYMLILSIIMSKIALRLIPFSKFLREVVAVSYTLPHLFLVE
jgi:hypothetical protein